MGYPPSTPGVKLTDILVFPGVATNDVGALGAVLGVADMGSDAALWPIAFSAFNRIV